jgi:hypothetical protein
VDAATGPNGVAVVLDVEWPERETWLPARQSIFQSYRVAEGKIIEIRGHDDLAAEAAIST